MENLNPLQEALWLIKEGMVQPEDVLSLFDPLASYRQIENLIAIGPREWGKALTSRGGGNPLNLPLAWWYPLIADVPVPKDYSYDRMARLAEYCATQKDWRTPVILQLELTEVAGKPVSLAEQYCWWGVAHDNKGPGIVRDNVYYSNWCIEPEKSEYAFAFEPPGAQSRWRVWYELPNCTTGKTWTKQQSTVPPGCKIAPAVSDALGMNLVLAATGQKLRSWTLARTSTICEGYPLRVDCRDDGVHVERDWHPGDAHGHVGAALAGVPLEFAS